MNKERLKLWIDALRSGKYEQGQKGLALRSATEDPWQYCCLGVACEVAIKDGLDLPVDDGLGGLGIRKAYGFARETGFLPAEVVEWLEATESNPMACFDNEEGMEHLAYLNDAQGWDFEKIADALEKTYLNEEDGK